MRHWENVPATVNLMASQYLKLFVDDTGGDINEYYFLMLFNDLVNHLT